MKRVTKTYSRKRVSCGKVEVLQAKGTIQMKGLARFARHSLPSAAWVFAALATSACVAVPPPAPYYAGSPIQAEIVVPTAPPPLQQEIIMPQPSPAHVWMPGFWGWHNHWVWTPGRWALPPHPGAHWQAPVWAPHRGAWHYRPGHWR